MYPTIGDVIRIRRYLDKHPSLPLSLSEQSYRVKNLEWELLKGPPEREVVDQEVGWQVGVVTIFLEPVKI